MPDFTTVQLETNFNPVGTQVISWASVRTQDGVTFWNSASPTRLTVPAGVSKIRLNWNLVFTTATNGGELYVEIWKNGSSVFNLTPPLRHRYSKHQDISGYNNNDLNGTSNVFEVVAGDYFELRVEADNILSTLELLSNSNTYLMIEDASDWNGILICQGTQLSDLVPNFNTRQKVQFDTVVTGDSAQFNNTTDKIVVPSGVTRARMRFNINVSTLDDDMFSELIPLFNDILRVGPFDFLAIVRGDTGDDGFNDFAYGTFIDTVSPGDELSLDLFCSDARINALGAGSWFEVTWIDASQAVEEGPRVTQFVSVPTGHTISGGGLVATNVSAGNNQFGAAAVTDKVIHQENAPGGVYWEVTVTNREGVGDGYPAGVLNARERLAPVSAGNSSDTAFIKNSCAYRTNGQVWQNSVARVSGLPTIVTGDVIMVFMKPFSGEVWFGKNGVWINDPTAAATYTTPSPGGIVAACNCRDQGDVVTLNGGGINATGFLYTVPAGARGLDQVPDF